MKRNIFLLVILVLMAGCLEDNTNYDYRKINNYDSWKIEGINGSYTLFPGESITLKPNVRLSIDTLNPEVKSSWLLNGQEVSTEGTYTFTAEKKGKYELIYQATDPKTGVTFPQSTEIEVTPFNKLGWLFLSRTAAGKSYLSMVVARRQQVSYLDDDYVRFRDTMVYVDFVTNLAADVLGENPIKFMEEYPYPGGELELEEETEILVLQESGPVELGGSELTYTGSPLNEFSGDVPNGIIKDAAVSFGSKWLLTEDNLLYFSVANVLSDLHSGRFSSDPAFNGKKFKAFVEVMKCYDYPVDFLPVIDENQSMYLIVDNASTKYGVEGDIIEPLNYVGTLVPLKADPEGKIDMSLFHDFEGEFVQHLYEPKGEYLLSLIKRDGQYYWHKYNFDFPYSFDPNEHASGIAVSESELGKLSTEMFVDFKEAAFTRFYDDNYTEHEWLFVASGNNLYGMIMNWTNGGQNYQKVIEFTHEIVSMQVRCFRGLNYVHVGVLLEDGTFYVLEVSRDVKSEQFNKKEVYKQNIKNIDPNIQEVVDMMHKYGNAWNRYNGNMN